MPVPDGDDWHYTDADYHDGKCNKFISNGKSQCLTSSPPLSSQLAISHLEYGILIASGSIPMI
jgi:hypothetical protein